MSNRELRNNQRRRYEVRQRGGNILDSLGGMIPSSISVNAFGTGPTVPFAEQLGTPQCDFTMRPGQLINGTNPDAAGTNTYPFPSATPSTGSFAPATYNNQADVQNQMATQTGGRRKNRRNRKSRKQRGGACGCMVQRGGSGGLATGTIIGLNPIPNSKLVGGRRRNTRRTMMRNRQRGGGTSYHFATDGNPDASQGVDLIGGTGPNAAALHAPSGCAPRAGSYDDPHAPINMALRAAQTGGAYSLESAAPLTGAFAAPAPPSYGAANAFPESCYHAPGSQIPVYNADSTAFNFRPSIAENNTLPPGVNVYNDVIQQPGRMGATDQLMATTPDMRTSQVGAGRKRRNTRKRSNSSYRKNYGSRRGRKIMYRKKNAL
jgi:hypothetical protein